MRYVEGNGVFGDPSVGAGAINLELTGNLYGWPFLRSQTTISHHHREQDQTLAAATTVGMTHSWATCNYLRDFQVLQWMFGDAGEYEYSGEGLSRGEDEAMGEKSEE